MTNNIMYIFILGIVLYLLASGTSNAATTATQNGGNCLQSIQAQYAGQWAEMNTVQRAVVGLRAAGCEGGR